MIRIKLARYINFFYIKIFGNKKAYFLSKLSSEIEQIQGEAPTLFSVDKLINSWKEELDVLKGERKTRFSELEYRTFSTRSGRTEVLCKKDVLKNFAKFTGKQLCWSLLFNKVAVIKLQACNFIKKETPTQVFPCEFCEILKNTIFTEHLRETASF